VARVNAFLGPDQTSLDVECFQESTEILEHFRVNAAIRDALRPRVDLPSGGYIIIEPTEALTVIDVNSGSFTRSANARETVLWTNCEAAVEISRQLKLRNIGGVVVIDFIDMESRRDQLQLLEHFTQASHDDSARPQIAQLTELGLVELTRKRQGQNIYELFSRACPSCGGLGHVAVLPGKDTLQPLANLPGVVRSAASARAEVPSPALAADPGAGGRRRTRRGGRVDTATPDLDPGTASEPTPQASPDQDQQESPLASPFAAPSRRSEPDILVVPMQESQERVFGWMGFSPALLLDPVPATDNLLVRVARPGIDPETVREEARAQLATNGSRRRRRGRGGEARGSETPSPDETLPTLTAVMEPKQEHQELITIPILPTFPSLLELPPETTALPVNNQAPPAENPDEGGDESRRRRRRSSATL
jgi:ribonuclease E